VAGIFCPNCGARVGVKAVTSGPVEYGEAFCDRCGIRIIYEDRSLFDHEGAVEIIYH